MFHFHLNEHKYNKIHFIGIGGISMSGIAMLLLTKGYEISGSDRNKNEHIDRLIKDGCTFYKGQSKDNIKDQDLFVYTDAILPDNEELIAAKATGKPCVTRGEFLGALMRNYPYSIAVSGSHGKSTTTSIISKILVQSDEHPTILLGGSLDEIDGNVLVGHDDYLVTEACEYKANILYYYPAIAIVLNIDADHLDFYKDIHHIVDTFIGYMKNLDENAKAIINYDDANCRPLLKHIRGTAITFSLEHPEADYYVSKLSFDSDGKPSFTLRFPDGKEEDFDLQIIGRYNVYNALAAIIACYESGLDIDTIRRGVHSYHSLHRRMEVIGEYNGATIMTDYGHHPTEIKATLSALKEHQKEKLICVFQPHTYSRTKALLHEFAESFYNADEVIVTEIYAAREHFDPSIHSTDLVRLLRKNGVNAIYKKEFEEAKEYLQAELEPGQLVITTGCGNPDVLARMLVEK